jgi:23S rRNA (pseudouridine1915-N3)-methyltransferase
MKIVILCVGPTDQGFVSTGVEIYMKRLSHYLNTELEIIPEASNWKKMKPEARKNAEGEAILSRINSADTCFLLDEKGREYTSVGFANQIQKQMNSGAKRIVYIIGGASGFSEEVYAKIPRSIALSKMTFSHQMVRIFFTEQLYRAMTILKNQPYHNI